MKLNRNGEMIKDEKLWFYEVPRDCVMLEEDFFQGEEAAPWSDIKVVRKTHFMEDGFPPDALSAPTFLTNLFWNLKKDDEKLSVKLAERVKRQTVVSETSTFETKEDLFQMVEHITYHWTKNCILYKSGAEIRRAIVLEPSEQMYIYLKPDDIPEMKLHLSKIATETEYYAYESGEID